MSTFMMSNKSLSIITNQIQRDEINGFRIPCNLKRQISFKKGYEIFNMLAELNNSAVTERYGCTADVERHYFSNEELYKDSVYGDIKPWMYQFVKMLDSYIYQCTEDESVETDLYKALIEYRNNWYSYLVVNSKEYQEA